MPSWRLDCEDIVEGRTLALRHNKSGITTWNIIISSLNGESKMHTMEQNRRKFERDMENASPIDRKILAFVYAAFALWIGAMFAVL